MDQRRYNPSHRRTPAASLLASGGDAIRALVFDFDGLILDTETAEHQAWREIYLEHGAEFPLDRWLLAVGTSSEHLDPCEQLERQLGELVDREALRRRQRVRTLDLLEERTTLPGVSSFMNRARQLELRLGVASSSPRDWVLGHLERLGLQRHFEVIRCADDVRQVKPNPELYFVVCRDLGVPAAEAIAIEDSPNGIAAAKAAGLYCVSVPNALTRSLSMDRADLVLVSLASTTLDEVLERARRACRRAS